MCDCSDLVVVCLGLDAGLEGEQGDANNEYGSGDKPDLGLPGLQQEVLKAVVDSKKPVVLVLLSGSALGVDWAQDHVPAIIQGWYPGAQGGMALAELLFGDRCPEGKEQKLSFLAVKAEGPGGKVDQGLSLLPRGEPQFADALQLGIGSAFPVDFHMRSLRT